MKTAMEMLYGGYAILMSRVKDIRLKVIPSKIANNFIRKHHYSRKVVPNSKLHFGAFLDGVLHGVMSFGSSLDKRKMIGLVKGTKWNEFIELNRMAFDEVLPKYSESRCISIALKLLKKQAPHIKWVLSFADGTQCGDGTIYRASGFVLTNVKKNTTIGFSENLNMIVAKHGKEAKKQGKVKPLRGYQLRYIYFQRPEEQKNLTVPIIPFSKIKEMGASMYLGKNCDAGVIRSIPSVQDGGGGAEPTASLNNYV
jgi:hypothetical protein